MRYAKKIDFIASVKCKIVVSLVFDKEFSFIKKRNKDIDKGENFALPIYT